MPGLSKDGLSWNISLSSRWLVPIFFIWSLRLFSQEESIESRIAVAGLEPGEVRSFLTNLQAGIERHDSEAICAMAGYPLGTRVPGLVRNASACRPNYSRIFNVRVVRAVVNQKFETLFANSKGVMVGHGEIWVSGVCRDTACTQYDVRIITVNN